MQSMRRVNSFPTSSPHAICVRMSVEGRLITNCYRVRHPIKTLIITWQS